MIEREHPIYLWLWVVIPFIIIVTGSIIYWTIDWIVKLLKR